MNAGRVLVSTLAMLWIAAGASAQGLARRTALDDRVTAAAFLITYGTTFVVHVYEGRSTTNAIRAGARETNPLIAPFASNGGMLAVSLARATATNVAIRSIGRRHKLAAVAIGAAVNFSYLFVATHNNAVADDMRRQRRRLARP